MCFYVVCGCGVVCDSSIGVVDFDEVEYLFVFFDFYVFDFGVVFV